MADAADIGLFPLDLVLLPGEALPLHLFEPRYRQLYADCVLDDEPFVIARADGDESARIGCAARFEELSRRHPDGRLDVVVRGAYPVEVLAPTSGRLYRTAEVRALVDEEDAATDAAREQVTARYREFAGSDPEPAGDVPLSYALAGALPLDLDSKQALLEERSEARRVEMLDTAIRGALERNARIAENARRASMNGHVPHP
ncbi:MAG: LON peptidase substrate-binding domain-containing protein [Thermoleophilia bacterium]